MAQNIREFNFDTDIEATSLTRKENGTIAKMVSRF